MIPTTTACQATAAQKAASMQPDMQAGQLAALQQLSSPALPIGGFSYSQGLEAAVELKLIHHEASARAWMHDQLHEVMAQAEAPLWCLLFGAWQNHDVETVEYWNQWFYASRETHELRQETEQMGRALARLAHELDWAGAGQRQALKAIRPTTLPLVHAFLCAEWQVPQGAGLTAYLFTWLENQVAAAIKSVPLGQLAGQRILTGLRMQLPGVIEEAIRNSMATPPLLRTFAPQYAIVSSRHESQFSRLFRS